MAEDVTRPGTVTTEPVSDSETRVVIAAVDGSPSDEAVIAWGADEALRTGQPLLVAHVVEPGYQLTPYDAVFGEIPELSEQLHAGGRAVVAAAAERALRGRPGLRVEQRVEWGSPAAVLVELSEGAAWVVVGATRRHGVERFLLGSVVRAVVAHARCPVAVVPAGRPVTPPRSIVVGVDGSPESALAAATALDIAERTGGTVTCVVGWTVEVVDGVVVTEPGTPAWDTVEERYQALVHEVVDPLVRLHPDVVVDVLVRAEGAARSVLDTATERDADLVVVGRRGRGGFAGLLLGSVSRRVVEHAGTVVAVAH